MKHCEYCGHPHSKTPANGTCLNCGRNSGKFLDKKPDKDTIKANTPVLGKKTE